MNVSSFSRNSVKFQLQNLTDSCQTAPNTSTFTSSGGRSEGSWSWSTTGKGSLRSLRQKVGAVVFTSDGLFSIYFKLNSRFRHAKTHEPLTDWGEAVEARVNEVKFDLITKEILTSELRHQS